MPFVDRGAEAAGYWHRIASRPTGAYGGWTERAAADGKQRERVAAANGSQGGMCARGTSRGGGGATRRLMSDRCGSGEHAAVEHAVAPAAGVRGGQRRQADLVYRQRKNVGVRDVRDGQTGCSYRRLSIRLLQYADTFSLEINHL
jgi:hypothetical protein